MENADKAWIYALTHQAEDLQSQVATLTSAIQTITGAGQPHTASTASVHAKITHGWPTATTMTSLELPWVLQTQLPLAQFQLYHTTHKPLRPLQALSCSKVLPRSLIAEHCDHGHVFPVSGDILPIQHLSSYHTSHSLDQPSCCHQPHSWHKVLGPAPASLHAIVAAHSSTQALSIYF